MEYARRGSRFVRLVRVTAETLQGIPSIIYGLFGMLFFAVSYTHLDVYKRQCLVGIGLGYARIGLPELRLKLSR